MLLEAEGMAAILFGFGLKTNVCALRDCLGVFVSELMSFSIAV